MEIVTKLTDLATNTVQTQDNRENSYPPPPVVKEIKSCLIKAHIEARTANLVEQMHKLSLSKDCLLASNIKEWSWNK